MQINKHQFNEKKEDENLNQTVQIKQNQFGAYKELKTAPAEYKKEKDYTILLPILIIVIVVVAVIFLAVIIYTKNS